jgi:Ran-binding protein 3
LFEPLSTYSMLQAHRWSCSQDVDTLLPEYKETRTPAKKNKIHLDATEEEEDVVSVSPSRSPSGSPPLSVSPPQEMKIRVRQISQGVEDLSWRNMKAVMPEKEMETESDTHTALDKDEDATTAVAAVDTPSETKAPSHIASNLRVSGSTMDVQPKDPPTSGEGPSNTISQGSDSDGGEKDKGLKRKFLDRGTSQGPQENGDSPNHTGVEPLKRPRDDADKDDNPRETKRLSPPPESESSVKRSPPPSPPKLVCSCVLLLLTSWLSYPLLLT